MDVDRRSRLDVGGCEMDRDIVIALAREAGCKPFRSPEHWDDVQVFATPDVLERFAALVAAHEREECAKAIDDSANICAPGSIQTVLREQARCIRSRT